MSIISNKFIPEKKIVGKGAEKQASIVCREMCLSDKNICSQVSISCEKGETCDVKENEVGKKKESYYNLERPCTIDGLDKRKK